MTTPKFAPRVLIDPEGVEEEGFGEYEVFSQKVQDRNPFDIPYLSLEEHEHLLREARAKHERLMPLLEEVKFALETIAVAEIYQPMRDEHRTNSIDAGYVKTAREALAKLREGMGQ